MRTIIAEDPLLADRRIKAWFLLQEACRDERRRAAPRVQPTITISRQYGAGGRLIAEKVAERLGGKWQVWDREVVDAVAEDAQVRTEMVELLDEHTRSWIAKRIQGTFGDALEPYTYRRHLGQVILSLAQQGNKIIVGRGAAFLLPDALNVRLRASEPFCVRAIMKRDDLSYEAAMKKVHHMDRERAHFTRSFFDRDVNDLHYYDMVLQTDRLGFDAAAAAIVAAVEAKLGVENGGSRRS